MKKVKLEEEKSHRFDALAYSMYGSRRFGKIKNMERQFELHMRIRLAEIISMPRKKKKAAMKAQRYIFLRRNNIEVKPLNIREASRVVCDA